VIGLKTKYWRLPYGNVDNHVREIARQLGYLTVIWTKEWGLVNGPKAPLLDMGMKKLSCTR
jgi:hypothetical protein